MKQWRLTTESRGCEEEVEYITAEEFEIRKLCIDRLNNWFREVSSWVDYHEDPDYVIDKVDECCEAIKRVEKRFLDCNKPLLYYAAGFDAWCDEFHFTVKLL